MGLMDSLGKKAADLGKAALDKKKQEVEAQMEKFKDTPTPDLAKIVAKCAATGIPSIEAVAAAAVLKERGVPTPDAKA